MPGDRHALVGLKDGKLLVVDLSVGQILEEIPAHSTELWAVVLSSDKVFKGFLISFNIVGLFTAINIINSVI